MVSLPKNPPRANEPAGNPPGHHAGAGMHFKIRVVGIGLAGEKRFELTAPDIGLELAQRRFRVGNDILIVLGLAKLDHLDVVAELALDLADAGERVLQRGPLLHQPLSFLGVVPEIGVLGLPV